MNREAVTSKVIGLLQQNIETLHDLELQGDTPLISSGLVESLDLVNMLGIFETEFAIELSLDMLDFASFENAELIAGLISKIASVGKGDSHNEYSIV